MYDDEGFARRFEAGEIVLPAVPTSRAPRQVPAHWTAIDYGRPLVVVYDPTRKADLVPRTDEYGREIIVLQVCDDDDGLHMGIAQERLDLPLTVRDQAIGKVSLDYQGTGTRGNDDPEMLQGAREANWFSAFHFDILAMLSAHAAQAIIDIRRMDESLRQAGEAKRLADEARRQAEVAERLADEARRQAEENQRLAIIGEYAEIALHRGKGRLAMVPGYVRLIQRQPGFSQGMAKHVEAMNNIVTLTQKDLRGLLLGLRQPKPTLQRCTAKNIGAIIDIFRPTASGQGIDLGLEYAADSVADTPVRLDTEQMQEMLTCLFENSFEALAQEGPPAPTITVRIDVIDDNLRIVWQDNGPGIPNEYLSRIWEPYFSLTEGGTGLGLGIVRLITEAHGGNVAVQSPPGEGAKFAIRLPLDLKPDTEVAHTDQQDRKEDENADHQETE